MSAGRIVLVVLGALTVLVSLGLLFTGGGILYVERAFADREGFITARGVELASDSYAIVTEPAGIAVEWSWWRDTLATLRIQAATRDASKQTFVGIADWQAVQAYLDGVPYDEISHFELQPLRVEYTSHPGTSAPQPPTGRSLWRASAQGVGAQTLTWDLEPGRWVLVMMNADGSKGIDLVGSVGARIPWLSFVWIGLLATGAVLLLLGIAAIYFGARGRAEPSAQQAQAQASADSRPFSFTGTLTEPLSPVLWLLKWLLLIPHYIVLGFLAAAFVVAWVIAFFAILFTGRYPRGLFEFNVGVLRWAWRVGFYGYQALGTDRYPPFTLKAGGYPADLDVVYPLELSRGLVLVKWWLLAVPHYIILAIFQTGWYATAPGLIIVLALCGAVAMLFTGKYPRDLFELVVGLNRWSYRVAAYVSLMTDRYPPFRLGD